MYTTVVTPDLAKSMAWFTKVFDWAAGEVDPSGHWAEANAGKEASTKLGFHSVDAGKGYVAGQIRLCFVVPSLDALHARITKEAGVTVTQPPKKEAWGGYKAEYVAPDGSKIDVMEDCSHLSGDAKKPEEEMNVCWTTIPVGDLARAKKFYTEVFKFAFQPWKPNVGELFQAPGDKHHKGHIEVSKERIQYPAIWLNVPDIEATLANIKQHGGEIVKGKEQIDPTCPGVGTKGTFRDSEGNIMLLHSRN